MTVMLIALWILLIMFTSISIAFIQELKEELKLVKHNAKITQNFMFDIMQEHNDRIKELEGNNDEE